MMTEIEIYTDKLGKVQGFEISGHTGFADQGEDIVCAGISVLAQTAVIGLRHFLAKEPAVMTEDGYLKCILPSDLTGTEKEKAEVILETICLGFEATKNSYEKYLRINKRRWD